MNGTPVLNISKISEFYSKKSIYARKRSIFKCKTGIDLGTNGCYEFIKGLHGVKYINPKTLDCCDGLGNCPRRQYSNPPPEHYKLFVKLVDKSSFWPREVEITGFHVVPLNYQKWDTIR
ncbi:hypothetical protein RF11_04315 [Thelohanellus kitauei]|uniref:Uncharacterized protein n=1 Tax=Thelohanellus kitauei TaxID=669202 RepID=A0A0C2MU73_THEKT|nr:hypothetical protein RF11_04315 [Thelohanellus kitauei]